MKGIGGPLLCIGDLLGDVGEDNPRPEIPSTSQASSSSDLTRTSEPLDLPKIYQDNFNKLNEALSGTDHSWTALTLKLCSALDAANKLVQRTNSNAAFLSEKVEELEKIVKRGDSAVASAKNICLSLNQDRLHTTEGQMK